MRLSVITATYNASKDLVFLAECLRSQTDQCFEWVIADGGSTDGTIDFLQSINDLNIKLVSQEDFGIYDALNRGIKASSGEFYLVIGADDVLYPNAIEDYKRSISEEVGVITAGVDVGKSVATPHLRLAWFYGMGSVVSSHAVGSCIRRSLHEQFGYYSRGFPICADQLFMGILVKNNVKFKQIEVVVGRFELTGLSSNDVLGKLTESFRVQVMLGYNKYLQALLLLLRLVKNIHRV